MSIIAKPEMGRSPSFPALATARAFRQDGFSFSDTAQPRGFTRSLLHDVGAEDHDGGIAGIHWQLNNGSKRT
jgi:hypothetical protein